MQRLRFLFLFFTFAVASCSQNLLEELASKGDDKALLESAKRNISSGSYASAITNCTQMSSAYLSKREPAYICASAFGGSCGLNMISFLSAMESYNSATDKLLQFFLTITDGATSSNVDDCNTAQDLLEGIGTAANRTADENTLMTMITLKKLDVIANATSDTDDDGLVDGAYVGSCNLTVADSTSYAAALWELKESGPLSGLSFGSDLATAVQTICAQLNAVNANLDLCAAADADTFTAEHLDGARTAVHEGAAFGLGDCAVGGQTVGECECNP